MADSPWVVDVTEENFQAEVLETSVQTPVLVDFWAPWCGPCRMVAPIVEEIAGDYADKVKVGKVNTDESPETATKFGIRSIPTLMIFKDGQIADQIVGAVPKDHITEKLDNVLS